MIPTETKSDPLSRISPRRMHTPLVLLRPLVASLSLALLLMMTVEFAGAQDIFGRISGTVLDSSGAVVPNTKITITNEATMLSRAVTADGNGFYVASDLSAGTYSVATEQKGFKSTKRTGNDLAAGGHLTVDFHLEIGAATETIDVVAIGESVNTTSGEIARTVDSRQVQNLALNTRNYMQLVALVPGVALITDDQLGMSTNMAINNQTVNGNRADQNLVTVDGGFNMDSGSNASQINNVGIDFVQEVAVKTSNFSSEYGRNSASSINVVTRSGGNSYHGGVFEYFRNDIFDAINPASKLNAAPGTPVSKLKPALRFNDFGWDFGGPIKRGKLFFFAGEEWKRIRQFAAAQNLTVPTSAELAGDFSALLSLPTKLQLHMPGNPAVPIPGNNLANAGLTITPDGKAIANVYRLMETQVASSFTNTPTAQNATFQPSNPSNWREDIIRIDYHPNDKHNVYGRYIHDSLNLIAAFGTFSDAGTLPTVPTNRMRPGYSYQVGDVWNLTPHLVNEAKFNVSWNKQRIPPTGTTWQRATYGFQFPLQFTGGRFPNGIPHVVFGNNGVTNFPTAAPNQFDSPYFSLLAPTTDIVPSDDFTWQLKNHTLKFGVMYARNRKDQNSRPDSPQGRITFDTSNTKTTGDPFADALLGNFTTYAEQSADPIGHFRFNDFEAYVNDSWKASRRLSFEIGVRYVRTGPTYTQGNNMVNFDPSLFNPAQSPIVNANNTTTGGNPSNGLVRPGSGVPSDQLVRVPGGNSPAVLAVPAGAPRGFYKPENLFGPRFGFAFSPFDGGKTAIRGGFGIFYDKPEGNVIFGQPGIPPFLQSVSFSNANLSNPSAGLAATTTVFNINAVDPNLVVARSMQYSLGVQQELPSGILLETSYVGTQGRHEVRQPSINTPTIAAAIANPTLTYNQIRPFLGYGDIRQFRGDSNSNYNALQIYATKRKGNLTAAVSYTWSKTLGTTSGINDNPEPEDPFNQRYYYGPLTFDRRHIFVATYTYEVPFFRNLRSIGGAVLDGWALSGITRAQSGQNLTANASVVLGSGGNGRGGVTRRPDFLGGSVQIADPTPLQWFNIAAFQAGPATREGNAPVGNILGPGAYTWDLSLRKRFKLPREGMNVMFQADAFNAFNRANWQNPGVGIGGSFGKIGSANPPRNVQFGLKLAF
jgi:hypothetical protein